MDTIILFLAFLGIVGCLFAYFRAKSENRIMTEWIEKREAVFAEQFKGISAETLKHNNESFLQIAQETFEKFHEKNKGDLEKKSRTFGELVIPIQESLKKFDGKIQELEKSRLGAYVALKEQVQSLLETQKQLRLETSNLSKALRTPSVRGLWGEMQLKRVVEMAGMVNHCDFFEQKTATDEKRRYRPDLIVKLPGERNIIVDAKTPLLAYLEAMDSQNEQVRRQKMKEHAEHIRNHIALLSRKSYWEQFQPTPNFVVLFLPAESFFSAALEQDPSLIEVGVNQDVILATPTTLIALLRAVASQWREEKLARDVEQVKELGKELYKRIADMGNHWEKVGRGLENAVQSYNRAVGSLESRVLVSARRFMELGGGKEIEVLEPIEQMPRVVHAPEMKKD